MKILIATALYAAVVLTPIRWCHSVSEYLITALGAALLLDRYLFRWLPWTLPVKWLREIVLRTAILGIASAGFYLIRLESVPWWEALTLGAMASLAIVILESIVGGIQRLGAVCPEPWSHRDAARSFRVRLRVVARSPDRAKPARMASQAIALGLHFLVLVVLVFAVPLEAIHPIHTVPRRTPSAQGLDYAEVHFTTSDGLELAAWLVPHPQARGNVIFCHGHGRNRGHAASLLPTLHDLRLNVLAFDFRGHGDSPGHVSTFGHEEVRDLVAAVHYMESQCPDQPLFIIGVSFGAAVTLQALPELPNVRGVWSEGCFSRLSTVVDHYFAAVPPGPRRPLLTAYNYAAWLDCGFWGPDINPKDALAAVRVPIYFCHGRCDALVPFDEAEDLYESYTGPKWHFWVENGSHYNLRQVAREEYVDRLRSFLEERLAEKVP